MKYFSILILIMFYSRKTQMFELSTFMGNFTANPQTSRIFSRLLHKFRAYTIIFHTEDRYVEHVGVVISYFTYNTTNEGPSLTNFLIYNHDKLYSTQTFIRPNVSRCVNFLFSNQTHLWNSIATADKIKANDVVIFVRMGNGTQQKMVDKRGVNFVKLAGKVILLEIVPHHGITLYDTCYYCGEKSMVYEFIEKTHNTRLHAKRSRLMPSLFRNLNGHKFKIVFIPYFPYTNCDNYDKNHGTNEIVLCHNVEGIEYEMIKTISKLMNFTYDIYIMNPEASFFDMICFINEKKADIAFGGISMTMERIPLVQFTNQYNSEDFTFLYLFSIGIHEVFLKFVEPFNSMLVWLIYSIAFTLLSSLLYAALQFKTKCDKRNISFFNCAWVFFYGMCEQSYPNISKIFQSRFSIAICLSLWWFTCLILGTVYRSTILSTVVNPPSLEPEDMFDLIKAGYSFVGNSQFKDIIRDLLQVPDPLYRKTLSNVNYGKDTCDVFEKTLFGRTAMLDETSTIQFEIRSVCPTPPHDIIKWLRISRKPLRSTGHAWATQIGAPFRQGIDYYLNLILSGGHFKKWTHNVTMPLKKNMISVSRQAAYKRFRQMPIKRFLPIISIYCAGVIVSIISFIYEIVHFYFCIPKPKYPQVFIK